MESENLGRIETSKPYFGIAPKSKNEILELELQKLKVPKIFKHFF